MSVNNGKTNEFPQSRQYREPFLTMTDLVEFKDQLISEIRTFLVGHYKIREFQVRSPIRELEG